MKAVDKQLWLLIQSRVVTRNILAMTLSIDLMHRCEEASGAGEN
jgi:hypothetical protein